MTTYFFHFGPKFEVVLKKDDGCRKYGMEIQIEGA
jgi:hypothetical protein